MEENKFNICIIGAGIIGLSIAYKLSQFYKNIIVVEKESTFGQHVSSRNSEVVHSGFYYPPDSLKAKLCVKGNKLLYKFADNFKIAYKKCGKMIVANNTSDFSLLDNIKKNAMSNGVHASILSPYSSKKIESRVKALKSLWIPSTGIIDTHGIMSKLQSLALSNDVTFLYNHTIEKINFNKKIYTINLDKTKDVIKTDIVINAGGLWAHKISSMIGLNEYVVEYYKGDYYKCTSLKNLNCLVYPTPGVASLGIHTVLGLDGGVSFGPNMYKVSRVDYSIDKKYHDEYYNEINKFLDIEKNDIYPDFSGIRPKIKFENKFNDFIIKNEIENGYNNFINLIGIDSPGVTSSLAIADYVYEIISK